MDKNSSCKEKPKKNACLGPAPSRKTVTSKLTNKSSHPPRRTSVSALKTDANDRSNVSSPEARQDRNSTGKQKVLKKIPKEKMPLEDGRKIEKKPVSHASPVKKAQLLSVYEFDESPEESGSELKEMKKKKTKNRREWHGHDSSSAEPSFPPAVSHSSQSHQAPQDYIRNTIQLPQMNHSAEELIIDPFNEGFAIVSFVTKEDLDVSV